MHKALLLFDLYGDSLEEREKVTCILFNIELVQYEKLSL